MKFIPGRYLIYYTGCTQTVGKTMLSENDDGITGNLPAEYRHRTGTVYMPKLSGTRLSYTTLRIPSRIIPALQTTRLRRM